MEDELKDEYEEPMDVRKFCRGLEEAWKLTPELRFLDVLDLIFRGYNLDELTSDELNEFLSEYIHQNQ